MAAPLTGQATCTGVNNAVAVSPTQVKTQAFSIKAPLTNSTAVWIGPSTVTSATGYQLDPGTEFTYTRSSYQGQGAYPLQPSDIFVAGASNQIVTWFGTPSP